MRLEKYVGRYLGKKFFLAKLKQFGLAHEVNSKSTHVGRRLGKTERDISFSTIANIHE